MPSLRPSGLKLASPLVLGLAVAAGIYVFGTSHTADYSGTGLFGRTAVDTLPLKSWLATAAAAVALFQLSTALWMYRKLPRAPAPPRRLGRVHRLAGAALVLLTLPVAYHCMFAYGVQTVDARVAVHSLAGVFLYGARGEAHGGPFEAPAGVGTAAGRRRAGHRGRAALVHKRALVLQRLQPAALSRDWRYGAIAIRLATCPPSVPAWHASGRS